MRPVYQDDISNMDSKRTTEGFGNSKQDVYWSGRQKDHFRTKLGTPLG
ncbi:hypothetical protein P3TCK_25380 [Photobacterium profundum 3TCK]|uniref:Uncharacterized protein n=1 Tax=Photobacterium profundum 3TCK TaxID=314280 RepID=Q1Z089_9GAMM|nr:hypothetical protein P3TCK_25380 [Photobacterium profundum 3TCK]